MKRYADVAGEIRRGLEAFAAEVRSGAYPADEHVYKINADELRAFEADLSGDPWGLSADVARLSGCCVRTCSTLARWHAGVLTAGQAPIGWAVLKASRRCARSPRRPRRRPPSQPRQRLGREPRAVAGAHREDDVAVEQRVRRSDADRQRVVPQLGELAALGAVEVRIGPDDDERRVACQPAAAPGRSPAPAACRRGRGRCRARC